VDIAEAIWVRKALDTVPAEQLSPLLNIGSSTKEFRTRDQPWITSELLGPLAARGVKVVNVDVKSGPGIDVSANLLEDEGFARLLALSPRALLCTNLLEHVRDAQAFARRCVDLLPPGAVIVVTGPRSYPYHRDPIDTMFRPTWLEAAALFPDCEVLDGSIVDSGKSYLDNIRARPWIVFRHIFRAPFPMFGLAAWKRSMKKLYWLFHNYLYYCVVLRKQ
jgi:hypothetical protein